MLHGTRSPQHRTQHSISRPMPAPDDATSSAVRPKSPQTSPRPKPKIRRPSVSSPMTWLSRASSSSSTSNAPYAPSRPVRISEPRFADPVEALAHQRSGVLGAGAIVVRTPQDALAGPRASASSPDLLTSSRSPSPRRLMSMEYEDRNDIERPGSPPLPPIPDTVSEYEEDEDEVDAAAETATFDDWQSTSVTSHPPPPPSRPPPSIPSIPDYDSELAPARPVSPLRPSAKAMASAADYFSSAPAGPGGVPVSPPQSPFDAILVSPVPSSTLEPSKIIVSLETSTATQRTTMATLVSRPSCLASFLLGLFPSADSDSRSVYSTNSEVESSFNSIFHHHLASSGVLTHASSNLHVFLDRPSAPYAHILAYLRSPHSTPESPVALPHAARLNGSSARLEALLELRDEACYLGLDELERLCTEELRHRQASPSSLGLGLHMRGFSNASNHSARSLHTLRERAEPAEGALDRAALRKSDDSGFASGEAGARRSGSSAELEAPWPSPPATIPRPKERSPKKDAFASLKTKPTGEWI